MCKRAVCSFRKARFCRHLSFAQHCRAACALLAYLSATICLILVGIVNEILRIQQVQPPRLTINRRLWAVKPEPTAHGCDYIKNCLGHSLPEHQLDPGLRFKVRVVPEIVTVNAVSKFTCSLGDDDLPSPLEKKLVLLPPSPSAYKP